MAFRHTMPATLTYLCRAFRAITNREPPGLLGDMEELSLADWLTEIEFAFHGAVNTPDPYILLHETSGSSDSEVDDDGPSRKRRRHDPADDYPARPRWRRRRFGRRSDPRTGLKNGNTRLMSCSVRRPPLLLSRSLRASLSPFTPLLFTFLVEGFVFSSPRSSLGVFLLSSCTIAIFRSLSHNPYYRFCSRCSLRSFPLVFLTVSTASGRRPVAPRFVFRCRVFALLTVCTSAFSWPRFPRGDCYGSCFAALRFLLWGGVVRGQGNGLPARRGWTPDRPATTAKTRGDQGPMTSGRIEKVPDSSPKGRRLERTFQKREKSIKMGLKGKRGVVNTGNICRLDLW